MKPGKERLNEASKNRPISLINTGGKLLKKFLIDRINHHLHTELLNRNQYGFIPQKSTVDAAMAAKQYALSHIQQRNYFIMISLDSRGQSMQLGGPVSCAIYEPLSVLGIYITWPGATSAEEWQFFTLKFIE